MQSLLRTRPENLDDLTVQVALVRPGPIQGKAVHPYIEAASGCGRTRRSFRRSTIHCYAEPLAATHGVVVFQDQVLDVAIALAGFTVGEAEGLRRAMSRKRSHDALESYRARFVEGAAGKDVGEETANRVYDKLVGFSGFGFPKSHAAAFGLLAYQSAWLRHYYPAEFLCGLLNEQPMGATTGQSRPRRAAARGGGPISRREPQPRPLLPRAVWLRATRSVCRSGGAGVVQSGGRRMRRGSSRSGMRMRAFRDIAALTRRASLSRDALEALVRGGVCDDFGRRRDLLWQLGLVFRPRSVPGSGGEAKQLTLALEPTAETPDFPDLTRWERMLADYRQTGLSVGVHPLELLRPHLPPGTLTSRELLDTSHGSGVDYAGLAIARQRPSTAKGIVFMLLEDEFGQVNLIVPSQIYDRYRAIVRGEPLLLVRDASNTSVENRNILVSTLETLGSLARRVAEHDVGAALPRAHHFGHR